MATAKDNIDPVVDYAMPLIKIEKLMRNIHDKCLDKQYADASELCLSAIAEFRILTASLAIMMEKER